MSAPFRILYRWAREALESLGENIPDKAVLVFRRATRQWEVRPLEPADVGAAPAAHTHPSASPLSAGFMSAADKVKLDSLQPERPAFREVQVGGTVIASGPGAERLTLLAGPNVSLTPDASNRRIIIGATGGGGGGGGGGGVGNAFATVVAGDTFLVASGSDVLTVSATDPVQVSGDETTKTLSLSLRQGSGSGLDADTVDGQHAASFAPATHTHSEYAPLVHDHDDRYALLTHTHANASSAAAGFMSASDKQKLDGIETGAQRNQNAFATVRVGSTSISASAPTDTVELVAGTNVSLVPDAVGKKVMISAEVAAPAFANVTVGSTTLQASTPGDTITVEGLGEVQASADTATKKVTLYVPQRVSFSRVKVGATTIQAPAAEAVLELMGNNNVSLTPDETNHKITFSVSQGPGSGLNADTVDGLHASDFATSAQLANYWQRGSGSGSRIFVQNTAPNNPSVGDLWIDTSTTV